MTGATNERGLFSLAKYRVRADWDADGFRYRLGAIWCGLTAGAADSLIAFGATTEVALPDGSEPLGIAARFDGNLWFVLAGTNAIGRITTSALLTIVVWIPSSFLLEVRSERRL